MQQNMIEWNNYYTYFEQDSICSVWAGIGRTTFTELLWKHSTNGEELMNNNVSVHLSLTLN